MKAAEGVFYVPRTEQQLEIVIDAVKSIDVNAERPKSVQIKDWDETRTQRQNRYLWGWIYAEIVRQLNESGQLITKADGQEMEWTKDILHEALAETFLRLPPIETKRGEIKLRESTAKLSKQKFGEYLENIERACVGWWNIRIAPPQAGVWHEYYKSIGVE